MPHPLADRPRLPPWFRRRLERDTWSGFTAEVLTQQRLHTVCTEAACPNRHECHSRKTAAFLLLGPSCTRSCGFCNVLHEPPSAPDPDEPHRVAEAVAKLGLRFAVLTSVTRDDLADGGADHFAQTIRSIRARSPGTRVEVLIPDLAGSEAALRTVLEAGPDVLNHNIETIARLYPTVRPQAEFQRSLDLLSAARHLAPQVLTKSGFMVGLGETDEEIRDLLATLRRHAVQAVTIGQYLQPARSSLVITRFVEPEQFKIFRAWALDLGFKAVASGPYVRSSHGAEDVFAQVQAHADP